MTGNQFSSKTILIVEDFDDTREMLKCFLELKGYRVMEGTNGYEAMMLAIRERPDLILMDLQMPVLDGFTATQLLRERSELDGVPVVAITAYDSRGEDFRRNVDQIGFGKIECLPKPINLAELERLLLKLLSETGRQKSADNSR